MKTKTITIKQVGHGREIEPTFSESGTMRIAFEVEVFPGGMAKLNGAAFHSDGLQVAERILIQLRAAYVEQAKRLEAAA